MFNAAFQPRWQRLTLTMSFTDCVTPLEIANWAISLHAHTQVPERDTPTGERE